VKEMGAKEMGERNRSERNGVKEMERNYAAKLCSKIMQCICGASGVMRWIMGRDCEV
jgi:hypothetical protein